MAVNFCKAALVRILADQQSERLKFRNGQTDRVDMQSAHKLLWACRQRPDLENKLLLTSESSPGSFVAVLGILTRSSK